MSELLLTELATEQNLTLGLLAVNRELISEEALCRALGIWTANPGRSLGEIFVEQGDLAPDRLADLQTLTRNHMEEHGNNVARALEAANRAGSDGRFRIVRLLSQGGLGEVYVAHDQALNRQVALKKIQDRHADHPECRVRFLREAEITGALEHPGIVPVYALGENAGGQPFYAMRLIQGETLQEAIYRFHQSRQPLDSHDFALRQLLGRFVAVCNAMAYAHSQGVIHRDLKPANIMLGSYGETLVLDWGLAKSLRFPEEGGSGRLEATTPVKDSGTTQTGRIMGTPQFMSPEQAAGQSESLTHASDIYSLGATLYCLLTGREPFVGVEEDLIPHLVRGGDFLPPRRRRPDVPPSLEAICLKAMQREPENRYPTARDLANDVERWLADEIVAAYTEPRSAQVMRWARRHKGSVGLMAASAAIATTILVAATLLSAVSGQRLAEQRRADTLELSHNQNQHLADLAVRSEALAKRYLYFSRIGQADRAWQESQVERTLQLLNAAQEAPVDVVGFEWHYLWRLYNSSRFTLSAHSESVTCVAYSPDGKRIATGSVDRTIRIWNARTGKRVRKIVGHSGPINSVAFSPDGARLASASADGTVKLWDVAQLELANWPRCICTLAEHVGSVNTVKFSLDGKQLASAGDDHTIRIWDAGAVGPAGAKSVRVIEESFVRILAIAFSPDSRLLASGGKGVRGNAEITEAAVWDLNAPHGPMATLREHRGGVTNLAFSPDGQVLATGSEDGTVKLWFVAGLHDPDLPSLRTLKGHLDAVAALDFSPDSKRLATASEDRTIKIWSVADGHEEMTIRGHTRQINNVAFSPDGRNVASASTDNTVRVWDVTRAQEAQSLTGHGRDVNCVAFSPNGTFLATGSDDETVRVWDVVTGKEIVKLAESLGGINCVAFSPDGVLLAGGNQTGKVYIWDFAARKQLLKLGAGEKSLWGLRFSPDGKHLGVASEDGNLRVWTVGPPSARAPWPCQNLHVPDDGGLSTLAFSPDGQQIATGSADGTLRLWDFRTGSELWSKKRHEGKIYSIAYSADGERLATVSADCTVRIWNTESKDEVRVIHGHLQSVTAVVFSLDGRRLVTGGNDRVIKLWDVETGDEALTLKGHADTVTGLAFSPDGRRLVSSSDDNTIRIWSAVPVDPAP